MKLIIAFLFGIGFGFFVQRAGFCFSQGFASLFMGRSRRILTMWFVILIITSLGFWAIGLKPVGQIRGYGFFNLLSGIIFGMGIALSGGCILGTLRQLGEGNLFYLIVILSFIPGMYLQVKIIDPILQSKYDIKNFIVPELLGLPAIWVTLAVCLISIIGLLLVQQRKKKS